MKVLAKLRRGVLEIAAGDECLYADPTFLQRAHLVWTFRNFRRLSVSILNQRQRQLVERLCESAHIAGTKRINSELIIGRAEFVKLPAQKPLKTVIVRQLGETPHAAARMGRLRSVGPLTKLPRDVARHAAEVFTSFSVRPTRSHATYSLVFTLGFASLVIISAAVGQRLWINHGKASPPSTTLSQPSTSKQVDTVMGTQPIVVAALPATTNPVLDKAASPAALRVSPQTLAVPNNAKAVTPPSLSEPAGAEPSNTETNPSPSRLRVFLAPRNVIYPSLPNSGLPDNGKKQILVKALVNANGTVDDVQVPGQSPILATAVAKTVRQWRYQPYVLNGQPVEVETRMIFTVLGPDAITVRFLPAGEDPAND